MSLRKFDPAEREEIERRLAEDPEPGLDDPDNPEWTEADFARARPAQAVFSEAEWKAFPRTSRGPQQSPRKRPVSLRLDPEVVEHFKAGGRGWQSRINAALLDAIRHKRV
jgi:uncharacterized protein (DUF4415 family)